MTTPSISEQTLAAVKTSLLNGRKIDAIKTYRSGTGCGLKEAKDDVESIEAALKTEFPDKFVNAPKGSGCLGIVAVLLITGGSVAFWLLQRA